MDRLFLILVVLVCLIVVYQDAKYRIIPNTACMLIAALFLAHAWLFMTPSGAGLRVACAGLLFGVSFVFWLKGWFGAGDVKFLGAAGLWVPVQQLTQFLIYLALASLLFAVILLIGRRFSKSSQFESCPYGLPIAIALIAILADPILSARVVQTIN